MKFINDLTIKTKLGILFFILLITLIFNAINIYDLRNNNSKHRSVHKHLDLVLYKYQKVITPLYKLQELIERHIFLFKDNNIEFLENVKRLIYRNEKIFLNTEEKTNYELWKDYKLQILILLENVKEKDNNKVLTLHNNLETKFSVLVAKLNIENEERIKETEILNEDANNETLSIISNIRLYTTAILFMAIFVGWIIATNIINSIKKVEIGLKDFFNFLNHKDKKINKINFQNNNEFSQMVNDINVNVDKIQNNISEDIKLIEEATRLLKNIKQGDLSLRLTSNTSNEPLNDLKLMMNSMLDNLENQIQKEIEKRVEQEELLIQQSKLASMGEMIGNIAHQWRQPLSQISAILLNIQARQEFDQCSKEYFNKKVEDANILTEYMSQTISDFQNFFKPDSIKTIFSIKQACEEALFIVAASLKYHGINLVFEGEGDSKIQGYKNEYSQVILNILSNARDVLLERNIISPQIKVTIKNGTTYGLVKIEDNAGGVPEEIIKNIFEPYFTTKHKSKGTGIGLYMSKTIIENNMNGFINVRNSKDGACFTIKVIK